MGILVRIVHRSIKFIVVGLSCLLLSACSVQGNVLPVVKIGLIAPFEGPQRAMAYDVLFAVKLAIKYHNQAIRDSGPLVELVALNDNGWIESAEQQAQELVIDPAVLGVIGPWSPEGIKRASAVCRAANVVLIAPDKGIGLSEPEGTHHNMVDDFQDLTGRDPTIEAIEAYEATSFLLWSIRSLATESDLTRKSLFEKFQATKNQVLLDTMDF